jgi:hypothetical protein
MKRIWLVLIFFLFCSEIFSQTEVQLNAGFSVTGLDMYRWYGSENVQDWGTLGGEAYVVAYPFHFGKLSIGAELGYQYFLWYTVPVFGYSWVYEYQVDAVRIMVLFRTQLKNNLFAEVGPGAFIISDWVSPGIMATLGYRLQLNDRLAIPIKIRTEFVAGDNLFVLGVNGGFSYTF